MAYCPSTGQPCIDDLCYGSGCLKCGESMCEPCPGCGVLVPISGPRDIDCECDPDDDIDDEDPDLWLDRPI
jgi:hypothetical protein